MVVFVACVFYQTKPNKNNNPNSFLIAIYVFLHTLTRKGFFALDFKPLWKLVCDGPTPLIYIISYNYLHENDIN